MRRRITAIAKEHLRTAVSWLKEAEFVKAYPPFYNGLESALYAVARANGVIDKDNNFVNAKGKARKAEDLLPHLVSDPRYRRYLRAWIFGEVGNPFRHGGVERVEDCRRQSLRLAIAAIGWLEIYGRWTGERLAAELEAQAIGLDDKPNDAAVGAFGGGSRHSVRRYARPLHGTSDPAIGVERVPHRLRIAAVEGKPISASAQSSHDGSSPYRSPQGPAVGAGGVRLAITSVSRTRVKGRHRRIATSPEPRSALSSLNMP